MCDVGYLYANFSLPGPICSRVRSDICDRQTDVRQKQRIVTIVFLHRHTVFNSGALAAGRISVQLKADKVKEFF